MLISVKSYLRLLLPLLLGLLASCTVYNNIFHPYRLPSPPMSKDAKAKARAAEKARHKGIALKPAEEEETGAIAPAAGGDKASSKDKDDKKLTYNELPTGTKLKYDKQLLLKKPKLKRRQYHHYDTHPLKPNAVNRENRKMRHHSKGKNSDRDTGKGHGKDANPEPVDATPVEASPAPELTPAPKPKEKKVKEEKVKEEKVKEDKPKAPKVKKAPIPKPDPTQQNPDH
jgi:hypothetical protein